MPKLNVIHIYERMQKCVQELEAGKSFETRNLAGLLSPAEYAQLRSNVANRKKTCSTTHEIQLTFMRNAFADLKANLDKKLEALKTESDIRAAKVFLKAYFGATETQNPMSRGSAALQQHGFRSLKSRQVPESLKKRNAEIKALEDQVYKRRLAQMTSAERDQHEFDQSMVAELNKPKGRRY